MAVQLKKLNNISEKLNIDNDFINRLYNNKVNVCEMNEFYHNLFNNVFAKKPFKKSFDNVCEQEQEI